MAERKTKLTPETRDTIAESIRHGAFASVAARAAGIDNATFYRWLAAGEAGREPYRAFREMVLTAAAEARQQAEATVFTESPFQWLRYGPGRERPGEPGWTETTKTEITGDDGGPVTLIVRTVDDRHA